MNIAKTIFDYLPQQTMILDETELLRGLLFLADIIKDPFKFLSILNGTDFSGWNVGHTKPLTEPLFKMLDYLFGTPGLFSNTHSFFEQCLISLASYFNPPSTFIKNLTGPPQTCNELWYSHCGGFEAKGLDNDYTFGHKRRSPWSGSFVET
jgi:hypothetical protein